MSLSPSSSGRIGARGGGREAGGGARETFVRLHQALLRVLDDVIADRGEEAEDVAGREAVGNEALAVLGELAFDATHRRLMLADACVLSLLRVLAFRGPHPGLVPPREREAHSRNDGSAPLQQQHRLGMRESKSESCLVHSDPCGVAAGLAEGEGAGAGAGAGAEGGRWRRAAQRVLAILGDNRFLSRALQGGDDAREDTQAMLGGSRSASCMASGVRVLAVDGGGVKGIASIRMLRALEEQCGRRLCEVFDLVVGTSAGGIIVSGIASGLSAGEIERVYSFVVDRAFSRPKSKRAAGEGEAEGGGAGRGEEDSGAEDGREVKESWGWWSKLMHSSSSMKRVLLQGAKYDAAPLLSALRAVFGRWCEESMIDHALQRGCSQAAIVSTLVSERPVRPFIFRSYQLEPPPATRGLDDVFAGSCQHTWLEAMRASSAAPYFFDEFSSRGERFQDGAIVANNPSVQALAEAQRLWPGRPIDVLLSVGTGKDVGTRRDRGSWGLVETFGELMVEAATSSDRVAEALAVVAPLVPRTSFFRLQVGDARCNIESCSTCVSAPCCGEHMCVSARRSGAPGAASRTVTGVSLVML